VIHDREGKELKNAYQSLLLVDPIFIHPSSVLFKQLPEYICYVEMVETSKLYAKGICSIDSSWLAQYLGNQCSFEKPIVNEADNEYESKKPRFDSKKGIVVCHRESTFGRVMWKVKAVEVEFPESLELFKWFARFLLDGEVCENLKKYENVLLASSSTMLKSWAKLQQRTESLLNALINENCTSKQKLHDIWKTKSDCNNKIFDSF
jgi:ATP-dependent RNA helicase DHX37/DHR1